MANILTCILHVPSREGCADVCFAPCVPYLERGHTVHYLAIEPFPIDHPNCIFHRFPLAEDDMAIHAVVLVSSFFYCRLSVCLFYMRHAPTASTHAFAFGTAYSFCMQPLEMG